MGWKLPPELKVMEALSAVADNRVHVVSSEKAEITDNTKTKKFSVVWKSEDNTIDSDDSGSAYGGYISWPPLAFLMVLGVLPYDMYLGRKLASVPWSRLKDKYKDHDSVAREAVFGWEPQDRERLKKFNDWILKMLEGMELEKPEKGAAKLTDFVGKE